MDYKPKAIICDIDGCILDTSAIHREIEQKRLKDAAKWLYFEAFANNTKLVKFNKILARYLENMQRTVGARIIFLTARSEKIRYSTKLRLHSEFCRGFRFDLYMRAVNDLDPAHLSKEKHMEEILEAYDVVLAIDDEEANLEMFKKYGIETRNPNATSRKEKEHVKSITN